MTVPGHGSRVLSFRITGSAEGPARAAENLRRLSEPVDFGALKDEKLRTIAAFSSLDTSFGVPRE